MTHSRLGFLTPLAALASVLIATSASGQTSLKQGEFSVQKFSPAIGPRNFVTVEGARTDGKMAFSLGLFGNYGKDPFIITSRSATDASTRFTVTVVETVITGDLLASFTIFPRLQLGIRLPYTFLKGAVLDTDLSSPGVGQWTRNGLQGSGLGAPLFEAKVRVIGSATDSNV